MTVLVIVGIVISVFIAGGLSEAGMPYEWAFWLGILIVVGIFGIIALWVRESEKNKDEQIEEEHKQNLIEKGIDVESLVYEKMATKLYLNGKMLTCDYYEHDREQFCTFEITQDMIVCVKYSTGYSQRIQSKRDRQMGALAGLLGVNVILGDPGDNCINRIWAEFISDTNVYEVRFLSGPQEVSYELENNINQLQEDLTTLLNAVKQISEN